MFANACAWLANIANANCHNQIWYVSYQLIASLGPYKEITWYKQHYMCTALVCTCSVLQEYYEFQSFTILCELDTLHTQLLKILKSSCNLQKWHHGTIHVLAEQLTCIYNNNYKIYAFS